jgi:Mlc titration factor MtfA (ptsG expression regulator)
MLSWEDVINNTGSWARRNVVIHEFAHKIDMERGIANGCPPFLADYHQGMQVSIWQHTFASAYDDFRRRVHAFERPLAALPAIQDDSHHTQHHTQHHPQHHVHEQRQRPLPMDPYAAKSPAEFFAVASEVFFVAPVELAVAYPEVYRLLVRYYRQVPISNPANQQQ